MATKEAIALARKNIRDWQRQDEQRMDHTVIVCSDEGCGHDHHGPHGFCFCGCTWPGVKTVG